MWKKIGKCSLGFLFTLLFCSLAKAQSISVDVTPKRIIVGESTVYSIEVNDVREPIPPEIEDNANFSVEPLKTYKNSRSHRYFDRTTGKFVSYDKYQTTFRYRITPKVIGQCTIPGFVYEFQDKKERVPPILFVVEKEGPGNKFVEIILSTTKEDHFIGQPLPLTITILSKKKLYPEDCSIDAAWIVDFPGFTPGYFKSPSRFKTFYMDLDIQNFQRGYQVPFERNTIKKNGIIFYKYTFSREFRPTSSGMFSLPPMTLKCQGLYEETLKKYVGLKVIKASNSLELEILDAPKKGRPENYCGAIGDLEFEAIVEKTEIQVGDAWIFQMKVSGLGNLRTMDIPKLPQLPDFKYYEPRIEVKDIKQDEYLQEATILAEIVPKKAGEYTFPPIEFIYFDVKTKSFRTLKSQVFHLKANKAEGTMLEVGKTEGKAAFQQIQSGVQYIAKLEDIHLNHHTYYYQYWFYWVFYPLGLLFFFTFSFRRNKLLRYSNNESLKIKAQAYKKAQAQLEETQQESSSTLSEIFITFLSEKLTLPLGSISAQQIPQHFAATKASPELTTETAKLIEDLEYSRFGGAQLGDLTTRVVEILAKLEKAL